VVQDDDEELRVHVRVKIRPGETESAVHANAPVDANVLHALAIADAQNHAAPKDAGLVVVDANVKRCKFN
jgi:hypothetical protein